MNITFKSIFSSLAKTVPLYFNNTKIVIWPLGTFDTTTSEIQQQKLHCKHNGKSYKKYSLPHPGWTLLGLGAYVIKNANTNLSKEKDVAHYIAMAEVAIKEADLRKAEDLLGKALAVSNSTQTVGVMCVYDMLATLAYRQGEVTKAEGLLVQLIEKLTEMGMPSNHNTVVNFSLKLSRIYGNLGQDSLAEMGFRNCIAIQKKKYVSGDTDEETKMLWINTLFWYGKFLASRRRYKEAKLCFESAYTMCAHVKTMETNQVMVMLYNLGEAAFATGDVDGSLRHMLNAVILGKSTNSPDLPVYYTKIGIIYLHKGIYTEAKNWCENGKLTSKRFHDREAGLEASNCLYEVKRLMFRKLIESKEAI